MSLLPETGSRTGGALLVDCLLANGVSLWTCVPGESFLAVLDALYDRQGTARLIVTRHEAAAANMAEAAGKLTGTAAACLVTRGPGASHASIALHTAYQDGTPLILIVGQVSRGYLGRQAFQEMDYERVFGSSAKSVITVLDAGRIPELVARAVHVAHSGRPGPVVLVIPDDVLTELSAAGVARAPRVAVPAITPGDRDVLHAELRRARRPVLIVGGPGWDEAVGRQVTAYAERRAVPVVAAFRWQDLIDNRSPAYAGYLGLGGSPRLRRYLDDSDLIIAFGARLDDPTTDGYQLTESAARVLLISQDADELCLGPVPDIAVHCSLASAATVLEEMAALGEKDGPVPGGRREWARALRAEQERISTPPGGARPGDEWADLAAVVRHVRAVVPDDAIITNGAGNYTGWVQRYFEFRQQGTQVAPRNGAMGYGLPAGLAAAALYPDRTVVTFDGDGCLLMSGSELATAVQYGLRVVVIVVNNAMFGTIRMHQERAYPGRVIGTGLRNPDFAAYARSFGALGLLVERTADFPAALTAALSHDGPALIEVRTDPELLTPDMRLG